VPAKLRARRKPIASREATPREPRLEMLRLAVPPGRGRQAELLGEGPEAAPAVVDLLRRLGVA
jgi:electron transfer flavoprotein beta subunit